MCQVRLIGQRYRKESLSMQCRELLTAEKREQAVFILLIIAFIIIIEQRD